MVLSLPPQARCCYALLLNGCWAKLSTLLAELSSQSCPFSAFKILFLFMCLVGVRVGRYLPINAIARGSQKGASDPLKLELQTFGSHTAWVLGAKYQSSGKVVCPLSL